MAVAGVGFLSQTELRIRQNLDDLAPNVKFSDATLLDHIRKSLSEVLPDLYRSSPFFPIARVNIAVAASTNYHLLPSNFGAFLDFTKIDPLTNRPTEEVRPRDYLAVGGPGFTIEGPTIRIDPHWAVGETFQLAYRPNFDSMPIECVGSSWTANTVTVSSVVAGTQDRRPHSYVGWSLRAFGPPVDERLITAYSASTQVFTVAPNFSLSSGNFEVIPNLAYRLVDIIALAVSRRLCATIVDSLRYQGLGQEYERAFRSLRLDLVQSQQRTPRTMKRVNRGTARLGKRY